ncbi:DUF6276 family protein [Halobaculum magnesiiphilum]|uniref:DUF6276 family protein n=1 Tax=Halobaculum magnesiiphilum TaxID=1017351 RepID=A0A8T8WBL6_9EURY|nr:DUF6276 family protein [Halobaculum magnesiiphilum]QZP37247.1 DUF6276 family protein [Halobaculum magnesiiphilum]
MNCPHCDAAVVAFAVPADLREHAPESASTATVCPNCLAVEPANADTAEADPEFSRVHDSFPDGDGGVAFALLIGTLPSIVLNKASARALRERAEHEGVDTALAFDRLIDAVHDAEIVPEFDLQRRVRQLDSLLDRS